MSQKQVKFVALCLTLIGPLLTHAANDLARNQQLVKNLSETLYERERVVRFISRGTEKTPLIVSLPPKRFRQDRPVLYLALDGTPTRVSGIEAAHGPFENVIFVGLPSSSRVRDFTSPLSAEAQKTLNPEVAEMLAISPPQSPVFVKHLATEVVPYLEKEFGPFSMKVLMGGSLGGIATLETALTYPESFDAYGVLSPSLWHNYKYYEDKLAQLATTPDRLANKCMLLTASEDEPEIFTNTRPFDRLLEGFDLPKSFRYRFVRINHLQHSQAIQAATTLVSPFVFNVKDILANGALKSLSLEAFQKMVAKAVKDKTCFPQPSIALTKDLYSKFGEILVEEKRFQDAFLVYELIKKERPHHILQLTTLDSFIWHAFDKLSHKEKSTIARDYLRGYQEGLETAPVTLVHFTNRGLESYVQKNKIMVEE